MNTYTKLKDGSWGLRIEGSATPGQTVSISTKGGAVKTEIVGAVLWTGKDNKTKQTISLCSKSEGSLAKSYRRPGDGGPRGSQPCYMCGSYYCEGARGGLCEDD